MKRIVSLILVLALATLCVGCGSSPAQPDLTQEVQDALPVETPVPAQETEMPEESAPETPEQPEENGSAVLVVYFSATGTTRGVAEKVAALTGADLVEIIPAQPYTSEDLNYNDRTTRATVEQNTADARPEIANDISLDGYTTVYLGYPIWWGQAPRILSTFVESHDFTGITVIPFCTSGSSDIGQSDDTLAEQAGSGNWIQGKRFSGSVGDDELVMWLDSTR